MKTYEVILTDRALSELTEISTFISKYSPDAAARIRDEISTAIDSLSYLPNKFVQVGVSRKTRLPVHRSVVDQYLVYYRIEADSVYVQRVLNGKRRQPKRFE